jgi:tRNA-binding EMAP/Myf-like protein|tara:strand:+ start:788 stop:1201 length:414 start_codon:yes stop_codon:yes gene_type:complete
MKRSFIFLFCLLIFSKVLHADNNESLNHYSHKGHMHKEFVKGEKFDINPDRFDSFASGLKQVQIAIVNVNGMVCDFCARGIEKSFSKDMNLKKIDVDLSKGKVLLAYDLEKIISFDEIKKLIVENGQNATGIKIIKL